MTSTQTQECVHFVDIVNIRMKRDKLRVNRVLPVNNMLQWVKQAQQRVSIVLRVKYLVQNTKTRWMGFVKIVTWVHMLVVVHVQIVLRGNGVEGVNMTLVKTVRLEDIVMLDQLIHRAVTGVLLVRSIH